MWERLYRAGSIASLVDWTIRGGIALVTGGAATALAITADLPVVAVVLIGAGASLALLGVLMASLEAWTPQLEVLPRVDLKMREVEGGYAYDSEAILRVRNARDSGGMKGVARGVTPELDVCNGMGSYVGWDTVASRDFRPTREEHVLYVAFKQAEHNFATATLRRPDDRMSGPIWGPSSVPVRLTLRGDNWRKPFVYEFVLRTEGANRGLKLEEAG